MLHIVNATSFYRILPIKLSLQNHGFMSRPLKDGLQRIALYDTTIVSIQWLG